MEKLFNWTIGSFFRTIGRLIAYFAIGAFIAYILGTSNIKLPFGINKLFLDKVKASEVAQVEWYGDMWDSSGNKLSYNTHGFRTQFGNSQGSSGLYSTTQIFFNSNHNASNGYTPPSGYDYVMFRVWLFSNIDYDIADMTGSFTFSIENQWPTRTACEIVGDSGIVLSNSNMLNKAWTVKCPIPKYFDKITAFDMEYQFSTQGIFYIELDGNWTYLKEGSQSIIDNQNQNTQAINNTITDSNTSSETNSTATFFNNQTDDTPSGLTTAVTAPLQILQNLVSGSTSPLCFTLNSKVSCIPDGSIIWGNGLSTSAQHWFSSGLANPKQSFITFFNLVVGGFLCYKMLLSMLRIWQNLLDPTRSTIEVMKL